MAQIRAIDVDGHVLERQSDIRKYLDEPWIKRPTPLWPGDQPWDSDMMDSFEMARNCRTRQSEKSSMRTPRNFSRSDT